MKATHSELEKLTAPRPSLPIHDWLQQYDNVVMDCTAALELDPCYVKALLRRAQANEHLEKYDLALEGALIALCH